jgi:hypothetical protein
MGKSSIGAFERPSAPFVGGPSHRHLARVVGERGSRAPRGVPERTARAALAAQSLPRVPTGLSRRWRGRMEAPMETSRGETRPAAAEADPDALLRMRVAVADAAFVSEGVTLGLLLKWAERAPPFDDLPPRVLPRSGRRHASAARPFTAGGR